MIADARARLRDGRAGQVLSCGEFSLAELRALLDRAALYIGGDSGPLHIAATTGVPIVGLVRADAARAIGAVARPPRGSPNRWTPGELPCRPCDQRVCAPGDFRCLTSIKPAQVLEAAERALSRTQRVAGSG